MDYDEFSKMLMKVDKTLKKEDTVNIFECFDDNQDQCIEFDEVSKVLTMKTANEQK